MSKGSGLMMGGGMALCALMCTAPVLLAAGAGSALAGAVSGAGGWLAGGFSLAVVACVLLMRRQRAGACRAEQQPVEQQPVEQQPVERQSRSGGEQPSGVDDAFSPR